MSVTWNFNFTDAIIILAIVALLALILTARYFIIRSETEVDRKFFKNQWKKILEIMSYGKEMNFKLAVIEADKLLDEALKAMYFPGATMAERLKFASYKFPKLKHVWWAHNVRNQIVHESRYVLKFGETKIVLRLFKEALNELNVL